MIIKMKNEIKSWSKDYVN